jgi:hypothetical protein
LTVEINLNNFLSKMKTKKILLFAVAVLFFFSLAQTISATTITFTNPLQFNTVQQILQGLLDSLQAIIVTVSIIFIIIGAILYITSAGNEKRMTTAKGAITAALIGLAIGIAAPSFLREISVILGWTNTPANVSGARSLYDIALEALRFLLSIVGLIALIMLVAGGVMYLGAAGDEKKMETAKRTVLYAIIGITIALASMVITRTIASFF